MIIIGITGQSGSGKGNLAHEFEALGYIHADADKIYHALLEENEELKAALVKEFGEDVRTDGRIDRKKLGAKVFGKKNARKLLKLNKIAHKYVSKKYIKLIIDAKERGEKGIIIDAPLLLEARLDKICDATIAVICGEEIRMERIMKRDGISEEAARLRLSSQKPLEFYTCACDYIFLNDGSESAADFAALVDKSFTEATNE